MPTTLNAYPQTTHQNDVPLLTVRNVTVQYEQTIALDHINFELVQGERIAVVGPNGAGKSTLFQVVAGILSPTHGSVHIGGSQPTEHICVAYVPQRTQVDWHFPIDVAGVVMMGRAGKIGLFRRPQKKDWDYVHHCLETVGMTSYAERQIGELSGGQQQRVFIARALAQEAEIMLMDEPLTGLDVNSQQDIMTILDTLQSQQVTIMVATHDLNRATRDFDRVMLLNHRLLGLGTPQEIFTTENLLTAYGGHLHLIETADGLVAVGETHCEQVHPT